MSRPSTACQKHQRIVFTLRKIEGLSTAETAECVSEENVKTRLRRARALIRDDLFAQTGGGDFKRFLISPFPL